MLSGSKPHHGGSLLRCFIFSWVTTSTVDGVWSHSVRRLKRSGILIDRARGPDSKVSTGRSVYISQPLSEGFPSNTLFAWYPIGPSSFLCLLTAGMRATILLSYMDSDPQDTGKEFTLSAQDRIPFGFLPWKPSNTALCKSPLDMGTTWTGLEYQGEPQGWNLNPPDQTPPMRLRITSLTTCRDEI